MRKKTQRIVLIAAISAAVTLLVVLLVTNLSSEVVVRHEVPTQYGIDDPQFQRVMGHLLGPAIVDGNQVDPLQNGDEIFPAMLEAIRAAERSVTFETYIYWSGEIGKEFADALAERARAGVKVHVLLDWVGSAKIEDVLLTEMQDAGVEVERYHPPRWYSLDRINNRTHRKLLVVDGRVGFTGGVGIADIWLGDAQDAEHWRDSHFRITGPAVAQLQAAFMDNWLRTRAQVLHSEDYFPSLEPAGPMRAQVFKSSAREGSESVQLMYLLSIAAAQESIKIANSYFVPDDLAVEMLVSAAGRGVAVEVLVPGRHIDSDLTRNASRSRWGPLLKAGIKIYEYQPTMLHCKVMIVDDRWVSVGSTNFDNRSFSLNDEANLNVMDAGLAAELAEVFAADRRDSRVIGLVEWQKRPLREKIIERLASLLGSQL